MSPWQVQVPPTYPLLVFFIFVQTSFLIVDELYEVSLPIVRDRHFSNVHPTIPYTNAAVKKKGKPWLGSASKVK